MTVATASSQRVAYLVPEYPHLSESFIAYECARVSKRCPTRLVALRRAPISAVDHGVAVPDVTYSEDYGKSPRSWAALPGIVRREGWSRDGIIVARDLGWRTTLRTAQVAAQFHAALAGFRPSVIHAHFAGSAQVARIAAMKLGIPYTVMVHGSDIRYQPRYALTDRALREADAVVSASQCNAEHLVEALGVPSARVHRIPLGVDCDHFRPMQSVPRGAGLLYVGRLSTEKGVDVLIDAVAEAHRTQPEIELDVIGDGPQRQALQAQADARGLHEAVRWVGSRPHSELPEFYNRAAAVVVPSREEGFGLVAAEALACGTPVIASSAGGLPEIVTAQCGRLVPPGCVPELATAIAQHNTTPVMSAEARQRALHGYSWQAQADALTAMWDALSPYPAQIA
jgi:glycosyltransferase involved in cell wall biosynthesis